MYWHKSWKVGPSSSISAPWAFFHFLFVHVICLYDMCAFMCAHRSMGNMGCRSLLFSLRQGVFSFCHYITSLLAWKFLWVPLSTLLIFLMHTGITDSCCHVWLSIGSGNVNSSPSICVTNILLTEPSLWSFIHFLIHSERTCATLGDM